MWKYSAITCLFFLLIIVPGFSLRFQGAAAVPFPRRERSAAAVENQAAGDTTLYRVTASHLRSTLEDGVRVIRLTGGVRIDHQTTTITSGWGKHYPDRGHALLFDDVNVLDGTLEMSGDVGEYYGDTSILVMKGNVHCIDKGWEIVCDKAQYDRENRIAVLTGNLVLSDSTRLMYADSIYYDRNLGTADAVGHVVLVEQVEDYSIAGDHAHYDRSKKEAVVDERPILTFDLSAKEKGTILSRWMHFDIEKKLGTAVGDVRMIKGETRAECDSAAIYKEEGRVDLCGDPKASNGPSGMLGNRMTIWYDDNGVERITIPEDGRLTEAPRAGSPWRDDSWIEGDSVVIYISDEKVDSVRIVGNSKAMYYPIEGEQGKVSNNFSIGDTMYFRFRGEELSYVRIAGKSSGVYNFLSLAAEETIDSLASAIDSTLRYRNFKDQADRVRYRAEIIEYFADTEDIVLYKNAVINYENKSLRAKRIVFNSRINVLEATGDPVLEEDKQEMYGFNMGYAMDSEAGIIADGSTKYEEGYYRGEHIFKVGDNVLNVYNSTYTTCDLKHPHYSLRSNKMKVYIKDKIVSGPIVLYIGEIPVFFLPFMANSLRKDRHSGFLRPNFDIGIDSREGRFIRGLGYYWATNDYTDVVLTTDFNERNSFRLHITDRYKIRYKLSGEVNFDYFRDLKNYTNEWTVKSNHSQQFGKSASFASSLSFVSSDRAQVAMDQSQNIQKYVDRRIYSSASFRKSWDGTTLSLSANRNQKLNVSSPTQPRVTARMPSFRFNLPRTSLWFGEKHEEGERQFWERALGSIMFSPNLSAERKTEESDAREQATLSASSGTSFGQQHKIMFVNLSPSVGMSWQYFKVLYDRIDPEYADKITTTYGTQNKNEFSMRLSSSLGTTIYGTFYPNIGPLRGIRHTINPSATYSYTPKLTESQSTSQSISYSVRNAFDLKVMQDSSEVKKNNVLTWNLGGSYNPQAPRGKGFSNIGSTVRTSLGTFLSMSLNHTIRPHVGQKVISSNFSADMSLGGSFSYPAKWQAHEGEKVAAAGDQPEEEEPAPGGLGPGVKGGGQAWSVSLGYSYSRFGEGITRRVDSQLNISGYIQLTRGWKVSYSAGYNFESRQFTQQQYTLRRDLHCWHASFIHRKFGNEWSYYFQIAIKALPDVMYERGTRGLQSLVPF